MDVFHVEKKDVAGTLPRMYNEWRGSAEYITLCGRLCIMNDRP